ncbi:MAG: FtsQ-type POTRA domain-containing protein [Beijerinckiaceae bacterium]|nr:FtsQ-type POTRA domain-containing protein [Beijerinckiaceae bacterium]MCZ8301177.1 FtsQ-type POTRA domain-containing protein [Beijerinckiaceae bacterium]
MDGGGFLGRSLKARFGAYAEAVALWRAERAANRRAQSRLRIPRGIGSSAAIAFILASAGTGFVMGGHYDRMIAEQGSIADMVARAFGFGVRHIVLSGHAELTQDEVIHLSGLQGHQSLPFLDPKAMQDRLQSVPLIAEAMVTKLYPDRLLITVRERVPFAIWQQDGQVRVIAEDGTAIEDLSDPRFLRLPHVVGPDANLRAREFVALLEHVPELRDQIRAGILVSKRRWTIKLQNGIDVLLPETDADKALRTFARLEKQHGLTKKAALAIDLRLPDRIALRLTEEAASQFGETIQQKIKRWGGRAS